MLLRLGLRTLGIPVASKKCSKCFTDKPLTDFTKRSANPSGLAGQCRTCIISIRRLYRKNNPEKTDVYRKNQEKWRLSNKLRAWGNHLRREYWPNLTFEQAISEYTKMLEIQKGVCYLCKKPPKTKKLSVDHNHKTGFVRKLLCFRCNKLLVSIHTIDTAKRVYEYLLENDGRPE